MENNKNYMKGFVPYAIAAAILSLWRIALGDVSPCTA